MESGLRISPVELFKETFKEYGEDSVARLGAALAYYTFTAFFPLLLVLISLIGLALNLGIPVAEDAQQLVLDTVSTNLPAARDLIEATFQDTQERSGILGTIGLLTGLWTASAIFAQLEESFNIIYDVVPRKKSFLDTLKARGRAALIVLAIAVLMIASVAASAIVSTAEGIVQSLPGGGILVLLLNIGLSLLLATFLFAALFKYIPEKYVSWRAALIGGVFTSITWQIGREVITWMVGRQSGLTAGTVVGSVLAFLVLVYYASQIIMFGAQLTATYDELVNPDDVRHRTAEGSALRGPGQPPADESGKPITESAGTYGSVANGGSRYSIASFGIGFLTGIAALLVGIRTLVGRLLRR